ncbi:leucine--tRNA ligase [Candidatus Gottesmanbacteria bacterium]|nr:leucine--tRNA ligase [Candidatus Gottesmanbacteria bacterium]
MLDELRGGYGQDEIEQKWSGIWDHLQLFQNTPDNELSQQLTGDKLYLLFAFAYPSGSGLHVGHVESKTALDILSRYFRMQGNNVFFPVGWDAFGLPAENYAVETGIHPAITTQNAIDTFRRQVRRLGISYEWANEIATSDPEYYKWTQWIFTQLYENGLAYHADGPVNWCPSCQTVLANEQVEEGDCFRCHSEVIQKQMKQWFLGITHYKDELIDGLATVDWPESTKKMQRDWIGRQEGANVIFHLQDTDADLACFTTRLDTVCGVTFVVVSPEKFTEYGLASYVPDDLWGPVSEYLERAQHKTEEQRKKGERDKYGIHTGLTMLNPVTNEEVPLYLADYVLPNYGTGIVMGVPAHDERDYAFAKKYGLPIRQVVQNDTQSEQGVFSEEGILINSGELNGLTSEQARITLMQQFPGLIESAVTYKLRDWLISRQRYWGAPIPIVYDPQGKPHPVRKEHLPWLLPTDVDFKPTGESPLRSSREFLERTERLYGEGWRPEYDTMDTFVDSSWYYLRYPDAHNPNEFAAAQRLQKWLPVDFYMIGAEHTVLHLLYSRFFTKFLRDQGYLAFDEPFQTMRHQGMILGPDGKKMSKSLGNVINPDDVIDRFGADTLRMYEMFMGPIDVDKPWDDRAVHGVYKFLSRVATLVRSFEQVQKPQRSQNLEKLLHQTIRKVTEDIERLKFNTAIAAMMRFVNEWSREQRENPTVNSVLTPDEIATFAKILSPFAPFLASEIYYLIESKNGENGLEQDYIVHLQPWPIYDAALSTEHEYLIPVQINGKVRGHIPISGDIIRDETKVFALVYQLESIQGRLAGKNIKSQIYVEGRIVSIVTD